MNKISDLSCCQHDVAAVPSNQLQDKPPDFNSDDIRVLGHYYCRNKVSDAGVLEDDELLFYVFLQTKMQIGHTIVDLSHDTHERRMHEVEERVFHYQDHVHNLPPEMGYILDMEDGNWCYELSEEQYKELLDEKLVDLRSYLTYGLDELQNKG